MESFLIIISIIAVSFFEVEVYKKGYKKGYKVGQLEERIKQIKP